MKNVFLGILIALSGLLITVIVMTVAGAETRKNELRSAVETAMLSTVENGFYGKGYTISDSQEFCADFIEALLVQIEADADIEVNILEADERAGLLSAEVIEYYRHPIGTQGSIRVQRTVLMEQYLKEGDDIREKNIE